MGDTKDARYAISRNQVGHQMIYSLKFLGLLMELLFFSPYFSKWSYPSSSLTVKLTTTTADLQVIIQSLGLGVFLQLQTKSGSTVISTSVQVIQLFHDHCKLVPHLLFLFVCVMRRVQNTLFNILLIMHSALLFIESTRCVLTQIVMQLI